MRIQKADVVMTELEVILENWERFRTVTLQFLDVLSEEDLSWRPSLEAFTCGQQLLHIAQTEEYYCGGLFGGVWEQGLLKLPESVLPKNELRRYFDGVRAETEKHLQSIGPTDLNRAMTVPHAPAELPLRWWLWFVLEHEIHHKAQLAVYLRQMGKIAPYFAFPFPPGERPDIRIRAELDGQ